MISVYLYMTTQNILAKTDQCKHYAEHLTLRLRISWLLVREHAPGACNRQPLSRLALLPQNSSQTRGWGIGADCCRYEHDASIMLNLIPSENQYYVIYVDNNTPAGQLEYLTSLAERFRGAWNTKRQSLESIRSTVCGKCCKWSWFFLQ